jgi:hypothetical protein
VAGLLNKEAVVKAVASFVENAAEAQKKKPGVVKLSIVLGSIFSAVVFVGIAIRGARHVITGEEATAGLLGTLIGYWFGQHQSKAS